MYFLCFFLSPARCPPKSWLVISPSRSDRAFAGPPDRDSFGMNNLIVTRDHPRQASPVGAGQGDQRSGQSVTLLCKSAQVSTFSRFSRLRSTIVVVPTCPDLTKARTGIPATFSRWNIFGLVSFDLVRAIESCIGGLPLIPQPNSSEIAFFVTPPRLWSQCGVSRAVGPPSMT